MITTEPISDRVLKITVSEKLNADDFQQLAPAINSLIQQQGTIRLLVDASNFGGWKNIAAFERHKSRPRKSAQDDKWNFCLTTAIVAVNRRNHEQTTPPEPLTGL